MIEINSSQIKERGPTPRKLKSLVNQASKSSWLKVGVLFHEEMRQKRFTKAHGIRAGYAKRKGDNLAFGSKGWKRSTAGQKFRKAKGSPNPLVFSGDSRDRSELGNSITATSNGVKVRYPGLRKLNFRHPKSRINMRKEFVTLLPSEIDRLAEHYDKTLDQELSKLG